MKTIEEIARRIKEREHVLTKPLSEVQRGILREEGEGLRGELLEVKAHLLAEYLEAAGFGTWAAAARSDQVSASPGNTAKKWWA